MVSRDIHDLIQMITQPNIPAMDAEDVYVALLDSGEIAIQALLDSLDDSLHHEHHTIASILCDILVDVGDDDALALLQQLVNSQNNEIFSPAARAIARIQLPQINTVLCNLLDHPAPQVRRVAAWQLGRNQAVGSAVCLLQHLDEIDLETLRGIIWSLGHIGDHRTIIRLEPYTHHLSNDIKFITREAIQRIDDRSLNLPFK